MVRSQPLVLWVGDSPHAFSGLSRVNREILARLSYWGKFEVVSYACFAAAVPEVVAGLPFRVIPGDEAYGRRTLPDVIRQIRPDVLVTCGDLWMMDWLAESQERQQVPWVIHCMPDGIGMPDPWLKALREAQHTVVCSDFGHTLLGIQMPLRRLSMIPLGVNPAVLRPLPDRDAIREAAAMGDKFVVGCVARNQFRKQFDRLFRAFADFARGKDDAVLYLHTDPADRAGSDLYDLVDRYGLREKVGVSTGSSVTHGLGDAEMCRIYNLFDVFALPTMGEGFGLPILEAMSCGVPVVATRCSSVTELVRGRGELIDVKERVTVGPHNIEQSLADVDHLAMLLQGLYESPERRSELGALGREVAEVLTWDRCAGRWSDLLEVITRRNHSGSPDRDDAEALSPRASVVFPLKGCTAGSLLADWRRQACESVGPVDAIEWVAVAGPDDEPGGLAAAEAVLGSGVVTVRPPGGIPAAGRLRAGARVSRGRVVYVAPSGECDEASVAGIRVGGKDVRVLSSQKGN